MSFYQDKRDYGCSPFVENKTIDTCSPNGVCKLKDDYYTCHCDSYYDFKTNCSKSFYENENKNPLFAYPITGFILIIVLFILYGYSIFYDLRKSNKLDKKAKSTTKSTELKNSDEKKVTSENTSDTTNSDNKKLPTNNVKRKIRGFKILKTPNFLIKIFLIFYCLIRFISFVLFSYGLINTTTIYSRIELILHVSSLGLITMPYVLCTLEWLTLLRRVKNIGLVPKVFTITRRVILVIFIILFPLGLVVNILSIINIAREFTSLLGNISILILIIIPLVINIFFIIKTIISLNKSSTGGLSKKMIKVKYKTYYLTFSSILMIINFLILGATLGWTSDLFEVIMTRKFLSIGFEFIISFSFWFFLQSMF